MKRFLKILKLCFSLLLALLAIRICISHWDDLGKSGQSILSLSGHPLLIAFIVLLVPLNWWLEAMKWKNLSKLNSIAQAWRDVLRGISLSLITPNRLGEVIGRVAGSGSKLAQHNYAFLVGSLAQSCVTLSFGLLGLLLYSENLPFQQLALFQLLKEPLWSAALLVLVLGTCFLIGRNIPQLARRMPLPKSWKLYAESLENLSFSQQFMALLYSSLRYLVFLIQFMLALRLFGAEAGIGELGAAVSLTYLITALVPASIIGELGVRESVAVLILSPLCSASAIVPATFLVWLLNLAIPAIIGSGFWIQWRRKPESIVAE